MPGHVFFFWWVVDPYGLHVALLKYTAGEGGCCMIFISTSQLIDLTILPTRCFILLPHSYCPHRSCSLKRRERTLNCQALSTVRTCHDFFFFFFITGFAGRCVSAQRGNSIENPLVKEIIIERKIPQYQTYQHLSHHRSCVVFVHSLHRGWWLVLFKIMRLTYFPDVFLSLF